MENVLIDLLETLNYPVIRQGSLPPEQAYPDTFITFWNSSEDGKSFYDNGVLSLVYAYDVNVYSISPETAYSVMDSAKMLLHGSGWIITDRGHDAASDEITHIGRGFSVEFLKYLEYQN